MCEHKWGDIERTKEQTGKIWSAGNDYQDAKYLYTFVVTLFQKCSICNEAKVVNREEGFER